MNTANQFGDAKFDSDGSMRKIEVHIVSLCKNISAIGFIVRSYWVSLFKQILIAPKTMDEFLIIHKQLITAH